MDKLWNYFWWNFGSQTCWSTENTLGIAIPIVRLWKWIPLVATAELVCKTLFFLCLFIKKISFFKNPFSFCLFFWYYFYYYYSCSKFAFEMVESCSWISVVFAYAEIFGVVELWVRVTLSHFSKDFMFYWVWEYFVIKAEFFIACQTRVTLSQFIKDCMLYCLRIFCYKGWIPHRLWNVLQYNEVLGKGASKIVYPWTWCLWFLTWLWCISIFWKYVLWVFNRINKWILSYNVLIFPCTRLVYEVLKHISFFAFISWLLCCKMLAIRLFIPAKCFMIQ